MKATHIDHMGSDLSVVNAARVSFSKLAKDFSEEQNYNLIYYLANHGHHSPFNHTYLTFHMKAPIFVARQLVKHKFMPWNEISRRYVDNPPEFYWPEVIREKAEDKKQGSGGPHPEVNHNVGTGYYQAVKEDIDKVFDTYTWMVNLGVAPEQARMVLPQNTYTEWYWSGTLHAWSEMYNLRSKEDAQKETRDLVTQIDPVMKDLYPVSWEALTK